MIAMSRSLKSVRTTNKIINKTVLKSFYSTATPPSESQKPDISGNNSNNLNSNNVLPPYPPGYDCKNYYGWGWGPYWNMKSAPEFHNYRRGYRRRGFGIFLFGFIGGIFAHKCFTRGCSTDRWERERIEDFYNNNNRFIFFE